MLPFQKAFIDLAKRLTPASIVCKKDVAEAESYFDGFLDMMTEVALVNGQTAASVTKALFLVANNLTRQVANQHQDYHLSDRAAQREIGRALQHSINRNPYAAISIYPALSCLAPWLVPKQVRRALHC